MSNTAAIIIAVTSFVMNPSPVPVAPFCEIELPAFQVGPGGSGPIDASGQATIEADGTIVITRRNSANSPIKLEFTVGPGAGFTATDIIFVQVRGVGDPDGNVNFRNKKQSGKKITVEDFWVSHGKKNNPDGSNQAPNWKYFIRVTNGNQVGWIDPGIENSSDN